MNDHYYTPEPTSAHDLRTIRVNFNGVSALFQTDAGVFSRDDLDVGTRTLLNALPPLSGRILDLGCGWGPVGTLLGLCNPNLQITMSDVNARAVALSLRNARANGVSANVVQSDAFENIDGLFDAVITNPPIRAGKATLYGMFSAAREHLAPGGSLYIVIRKQQGAPSALKMLKENYASAEIIDRNAGFWVIRANL